MALLERVSTLIRANINDLIDKAEDPEKMLKQLILDMQNQLMQVKTQVAIAIADQHLLAKKQKENETNAMDWFRKAELAVDKRKDDLARPALERAITYKQTADSFAEQLEDQKQQVENLKTALRSLEQKLAETTTRSELLMSQHRRARVLNKVTDLKGVVGTESKAAAFERMRDKVQRTEALSEAKAELASVDDLDQQIMALGRADEIEHLLTEIKARKGLLAESSALAKKAEQ